jgi:TPR repeat protein
MANLAYGLSRRGEEEEAQDWYRRAVEAGNTPGGVQEEVNGE